MDKVIIVGIGETADIAYEYFSVDRCFDVVAFAVNRQYKTASLYQNKPLVPLEELQAHYPSGEYKVFVAMSSGKLNRDRQKVYEQIKQLGYSCVSYISPRAFVWRTAKIGENCFIFENVVIQHKVEIGNNVVIWSNSCIAHQTKIYDHVFVAPCCAICGYCEIGANCFIGANSTLADHSQVKPDCFIGMGATISKEIKENSLVVPIKSKFANTTAKALCKVDD